jgi:hypothetical protein
MFSLRRMALAVPMLAACALAAAPAAAQGTAKPAAPPPGTRAAKPDPKKAAEEAKKAEEAKAAEAKAAEDAKKAEEAKAAPAAVTTVEPPAEVWDVTDGTELPGKRYIFIGARYRGNIIPQFMLNVFVDEGATVYSNTIGLEIEMRKDGFSLIPALSFTEYGTGDILFKEKGAKDIPQNYSFINSSMKAIYATADLLWSVPISKKFDFEYGAGFGLGIIFGDLRNNWLYQVTPGDPNQSFTTETGLGLGKCQTEGQAVGCNRQDHQNSEDAKVGAYSEKSWFDGGAKPVIFPWISLPQFGLRFKPRKDLVGRIGIGFALTGFWFGLNAQYGLEQKPKP